MSYSSWHTNTIWHTAPYTSRPRYWATWEKLVHDQDFDIGVTRLRFLTCHPDGSNVIQEGEEMCHLSTHLQIRTNDFLNVNKLQDEADDIRSFLRHIHVIAAWPCYLGVRFFFRRKILLAHLLNNPTSLFLNGRSIYYLLRLKIGLKTNPSFLHVAFFLQFHNNST